MEWNKKYAIGVIGLGAMGSNLLLNIADHGFSGAGYDKNGDKVARLDQAGAGKNVKGFTSLSQFLESLESPRVLLLLVPAGEIVDDVIAGVKPFLAKADILIDGGNSHFADTERRSASLGKQGLYFFGMGISGGEDGARYGPSLMPGGDKRPYDQVRPIFEAIAARVNDEPCVAYMGPGASGHFVKMVHNGIEYALMQLIAETYEFLRMGLRLENAEIREIFDQWSKGRLQSYLIEITARIFSFQNADSGHLLLDDIRDEAKSKGTGKWASQAAMDLNVPVPLMDVAVSMRDLSKFKLLRTQASNIYAGNPQMAFSGKRDEYLEKIEQAFYFSMITAYAQGMHLLYRASETYHYNLELDQIAKIWRGGCIIRSLFLEDIYSAFRSNAKLEHLFFDESVQSSLKGSVSGLRTVVAEAASYGLALPAYAASLCYFDAFRSERMPANLIQAQRDLFGAHGYELMGKDGFYHSEWDSNVKDET